MLKILIWKVNERNAPYVLVAAGVVFLIGFVTGLCPIEISRFAFILAVAALAAPFLFMPPGRGSAIWVAVRGFFARNPRAVLFLVFLGYLVLIEDGPDIFASPIVNRVVTYALCMCCLRISLRERAESIGKRSQLTARVSAWTFSVLTSAARHLKSNVEE